MVLYVHGEEIEYSESAESIVNIVPVPVPVPLVRWWDKNVIDRRGDFMLSHIHTVCSG